MVIQAAIHTITQQQGRALRHCNNMLKTHIKLASRLKVYPRLCPVSELQLDRRQQL